MGSKGFLYAFEGPDGVGKTTLSLAFAAALQKRGIECVQFSFPGSDEGTLGKHVHALHHAPASFGIEEHTPTSLQLLHVAAHIDAIERAIRPAVAAGISVVLDRFWWSTWAYGVVLGANLEALDAMIHIERATWGDLAPSRVFLLWREAPFNVQQPRSQWWALKRAYEELATRESDRTPICRIESAGAVDNLVDKLMKEAAKVDQRLREGYEGLDTGT